MTVVAGVSLFDGVMLLSDARATIRVGGKSDLHCDIVQKLIPIAPTVAIGFSGDIRTVSFLISLAGRQLRNRRHQDAVSVMLWLPRLFRAGYRRFAERRQADRVSFIVGSVLTGRNNIVERQKVVDIMRTIASGASIIHRTFLPDILVRILQTSSATTHVTIPGTGRGMLYAMHSPDFGLQPSKTLEYCAIGSGLGAVREINRNADWIFAGLPGNDFAESMALRDAVMEFIAAERIVDVGGMYPCLKIDERGIRLLGMTMQSDNARVSLRYDSGLARWMQKNEITGNEVMLLRPWEINAKSIKRSILFDDFAEAIREFNGRRLGGETANRL